MKELLKKELLAAKVAAYQVHQAQKAHQVDLENLEGPVYQECLEIQEDHQANRVNQLHHHRVSHVHLVHQGLLDHQDHLEMQDQTEHQAWEVEPEHRVQQGQKDHQDCLENLGHKDHRVHQERMRQTKASFQENLDHQAI